MRWLQETKDALGDDGSPSCMGDPDQDDEHDDDYDGEYPDRRGKHKPRLLQSSICRCGDPDDVGNAYELNIEGFC